jgi:hypothetical protein
MLLEDQAFQYILTIFLAAIAYYLKNMASDVRKLVENVSRHEAQIGSMDNIYCKKAECPYLNRERDNGI